MKRGIITVQFNWIFVLVAGSLILAGTVTFILMNKGVNEKQDYSKALRGIKTFITGAYASKGKSLALPINGLVMTYDESQLRLGSSVISEYMLFAPHKIKGNKLLIWSDDFSVPYLVTNVAYMTTPQVRYVFVYDDTPLSLKMLYGLNASFDNRTFRSFVKYDDINSIEDFNNYYVVFAFLNTNLKENMPGVNGEKYGVEIKYDDNNFTGKVRFYSYQSHSYEGTSVFFGEKMIEGAVVSGDYSVYNENIKQMFERAKAISYILRHKAEALKSGSDNENIQEWYDSSAQRLATLEGLFEKLSVNPKQLIVVKGTLLQNLKELSIQNKKLFLKSSPTIY